MMDTDVTYGTSQSLGQSRTEKSSSIVLNVDKGLGGRIDMSTSLISGSIRGYS